MLHRRLEAMTRVEFIKFLSELQRDLMENPEEWENQNLSDFLEAMSGYAKDIDGYYENIGQNIDVDQPTWRLFADILKGVKTYE